jgi:hypothetical protein
MYQMLDENWGTYLALPGEVYSGTGHPSVDVLRRSLAHFDSVDKDPRYRALAGRPEFQSTLGLLKRYVASLSQAGSPLNLPPPPVQTGSAAAPQSRF